MSKVSESEYLTHLIRTRQSLLELRLETPHDFKHEEFHKGIDSFLDQINREIKELEDKGIKPLDITFY